MKKTYFVMIWLAVGLSAMVVASVIAVEAETTPSEHNKTTAIDRTGASPVMPTKAPTSETIVQKPPASPASGETIEWQVLSSGGTDAASNGYHLQGTVAQTAVGVSASNGDKLSHGYWQSFAQGCCIGLRGNANNDPEDKTNISDVTYLLDFLFGIPTGPEPVCWEEGNANGDPDEKVNVSDVSYLLAYLFGIPSGPAPPACP